MQGWIFLSGMMGSGKSSVGRALAAKLGAGFVDLDERIAAREGRGVREIFSERGEAAFRALEAAEVEELLALHAPAVVALGGGTVVRAATRRRLLDAGPLFTLHAPAAELARRLASAVDRPLLAGREALATLGELIAERAPAYAECFAAVSTEARAPERVADEIAQLAGEARVVVALGERSYRVEIGVDRLSRLGARCHDASAVVLVTDENVGARWGERAEREIGRACVRVTLPAGEEHKTLASVERIWDAALEARIDRDAVLVALGGGVVGDLAGFAASTLLRGVRVLQVPTSLLAMVDSSVGGKTGLDRAQGKNLIGSFHQPSAVLCDVTVLGTLPAAELRAGLGEVVKSAWLAGDAAVRAIEQDAPLLVAGDATALARAVHAAVRLKARIVARDERDAGERQLLNLGHTIGHAIEAASGYSVRHGEAVALGMLAAFRVEAALGGADAVEHGERMRALLERLGLPTEVALDEATLAFVESDKKRRGGQLRYVLPGAPGSARTISLDPDRLRAWLA